MEPPECAGVCGRVCVCVSRCSRGGSPSLLLRAASLGRRRVAGGRRGGGPCGEGSAPSLPPLRCPPSGACGAAVPSPPRSWAGGSRCPRMPGGGFAMWGGLLRGLRIWLAGCQSAESAELWQFPSPRSTCLPPLFWDSGGLPSSVCLACPPAPSLYFGCSQTRRCPPRFLGSCLQEGRAVGLNPPSTPFLAPSGVCRSRFPPPIPPIGQSFSGPPAATFGPDPLLIV